MKVCKYCGTDVENDTLKYCPCCGAEFKTYHNNTNSDGYKNPPKTYNPYTREDERRHRDERKYYYETNRGVSDYGGCGWFLLGFLIPLIGLILYLVWKDEKPYTASSVGKGALISVIISVVLAVLSTCALSCAISGLY